ncbi:ATP-grasp domain-containing protein [Paracoccaceae bacterium]|nr:ATP-grasp domain-containing protein [Paracoccaceae bacterium]
MVNVRIAVTGVGSLIGQSVARSLKDPNSGLSAHILGLDYFSNSIGYYFSDSKIVLPDILDANVSEKDWLKCLTESVIAEKIDFLIPCVDHDLKIVAKNKKLLEKTCGIEVLSCPLAFVDIFRDKLKTADWLRKNGLTFPKTVQLSGESFEQLSDLLGCPFITKPRWGSRSRGLGIIGCKEDFQKIDNSNRDMIAQQLIGSDEEELTCGVLIVDGMLDSLCILNRTLKDGNTWSAFSVSNSTVERYLTQIANKISADGAFNVQLRLNENVPVAFEINPRFSGTTHFRTILGVNQPARYILRKKNEVICNDVLRLRKGCVRRVFSEILEEANDG